MVKHDEVAGEKYEASLRAADRLLKKLGAALERLDVWVGESPDDEHYITGVVVKVRYDSVGDVLIMVKADSAKGPVIAFHAADSMSASVLGLVNRLDNGQIQWKEDVPYEQRKDK